MWWVAVVREAERMPREHLHNFMSWTWAGFLPVTFCFAPLLLEQSTFSTWHLLLGTIEPLAVISALSPVQRVELCKRPKYSIHSISARDNNPQALPGFSQFLQIFICIQSEIIIISETHYGFCICCLLFRILAENQF